MTPFRGVIMVSNQNEMFDTLSMFSEFFIVQHSTFRIRLDTDAMTLISSEDIDISLTFFNVKTYMTFPAAWRFPPEHYNVSP